MRNLLVMGVLFLTSNLAVAVGLEQVTGTYTLKTAVVGYCYPNVRVESENFLNSEGPDLGIYGRPGAGEIVYQFVDINSGEKVSPEEDPMAGKVTGYVTSKNEFDGVHLSGVRVSADLSGKVLSDTRFQGEFKNGELSYSTSDLNRINEPGFSSASTCVYRKD